MRQNRHGTATTELALCLPLLLLFCFGTIEACAAIYLKQTLTIAAYEGVRTANFFGSTNSDVQATCERIFADRGIVGATISTTPTDLRDAAAGEFIAVECSADTTPNLLCSPWLFAGQVVVGRAEFMKKY